MKLNLVFAPNNLLLKKCESVKEITDKHKILINQMFQLMKSFNGIGLSAPQVGRLTRILVMDTTHTTDGVRRAMINPEIVSVSEETQTNIEGCLSFGSLTTITIRPKEVTVKYLNVNNEEIIETFKGLSAQCFCHEYDHLQGKLFINL